MPWRGVYESISVDYSYLKRRSHQGFFPERGRGEEICKVRNEMRWERLIISKIVVYVSYLAAVIERPVGKQKHQDVLCARACVCVCARVCVCGVHTEC